MKKKTGTSSSCFFRFDISLQLFLSSSLFLCFARSRYRRFHCTEEFTFRARTQHLARDAKRRSRKKQKSAPSSLFLSFSDRRPSLASIFSLEIKASPMGDNHTVYERPEGQTTQWEDIQRKMGNMAPAEKVWKPAAWSAKKELPRGLATLVCGDADADAVADLEGEFDDDRFLEEYRLKRLAELREKEEKAAAVGKRGIVATISKEDYVSKVTRASAGVDPDNDVVAAAEARGDADEEEEEDEEEEGRAAALSAPKPTGPPRWIVCHMFRDGAAGCDDVDDALRQLADSPATSAPAAASSASSASTKSFPRVSFVRIRADDVAPGYPASALPTLLVYFGGECVASLKGREACSGGGGGKNLAAAEEKRSSYSKTPRDVGRLSTSAVVDALEAAAPGIVMGGGGSKANNRSGNESDSGGSDSE